MGSNTGPNDDKSADVTTRLQKRQRREGGEKVDYEAVCLTMGLQTRKIVPEKDETNYRQEKQCADYWGVNEVTRCGEQTS